MTQKNTQVKANALFTRAEWAGKRLLRMAEMYTYSMYADTRAYISKQRR